MSRKAAIVSRPLRALIFFLVCEVSDIDGVAFYRRQAYMKISTFLVTLPFCFSVITHLTGNVAFTQMAATSFSFNPAAAGPPRHPPAAGGHKVAPLYFCEDIVATRGDKEAKLCTQLLEYLAEVVSKFGVDPI